jgi:hypothetical protein
MNMDRNAVELTYSELIKKVDGLVSQRSALNKEISQALTACARMLTQSYVDVFGPEEGLERFVDDVLKRTHPIPSLKAGMVYWRLSRRLQADPPQTWRVRRLRKRKNHVLGRGFFLPARIVRSQHNSCAFGYKKRYFFVLSDCNFRRIRQ